MSFDLKNYKFLTGAFNNRNVFFVRFPYNRVWMNELKAKFSTAKWSVDKKCWYLPDVDAVMCIYDSAPSVPIETDKRISAKI
jgi:hypothetical protein